MAHEVRNSAGELLGFGDNVAGALGNGTTVEGTSPGYPSGR